MGCRAKRRIGVDSGYGRIGGVGGVGGVGGRGRRGRGEI